MKKLFLWQRHGPGQCITPHHRLAVAKSLLQNPETRVHHIPTPTTPLGGSRELAEYGWGVGAGKGCSTQGEAGHPPCHQTQPRMHETRTHSVAQSGLLRPFQCLPNQSLLSKCPSKAGTPGALMLCFLASWGSSQVPSGLPRRSKVWRAGGGTRDGTVPQLSWRSAVTCFLD